mmetsp:Transcript_42011/g.121813  ORF Transcript_42011/g.121813 Transcript_42011/m.121813 type:complete len:215 (+) Transcript_42011:871-1515(+)
MDLRLHPAGLCAQALLDMLEILIEYEVPRVNPARHLVLDQPRHGLAEVFEGKLNELLENVALQICHPPRHLVLDQPHHGLAEVIESCGLTCVAKNLSRNNLSCVALPQRGIEKDRLPELPHGQVEATSRTGRPPSLARRRHTPERVLHLPLALGHCHLQAMPIDELLHPAAHSGDDQVDIDLVRGLHVEAEAKGPFRGILELQPRLRIRHSGGL